MRGRVRSRAHTHIHAKLAYFSVSWKLSLRMSLQPEGNYGYPPLVSLPLVMLATSSRVSGDTLEPVPRQAVKNECLPGWLPILFGCLLLFATWMPNCTLLGGVFQVIAKSGVVRVAYYFVGSQTVASLIYATLNLPPGLLILIFG